MILSDQDIYSELAAGGLKVEPRPPLRAFQPASLEVHLADAATREHARYADDGDEAPMWWLEPGEFALGSTLEKVTLPATLCAQVNGKSSLGRLGLLVHATAGFVDPGFSGELTLELKNLSNHVIPLSRGMAVAQLVFHRLTSPAQRPYGHEELGSHYQGQVGIRRSYMDGSAGYSSLGAVSPAPSSETGIAGLPLGTAMAVIATQAT